jgi:hypothetical protein
MTNILWVGAEDLEYVQMGGAAISTSSTTFRSGFGSRCSLPANGFNTFWESIKEYSESDFWFSARCVAATSGNATNTVLIGFLDDSLNVRVRVVGLGSNSWKVQKVDASGTATDIGNHFFWPISTTSNVLDKIDIHIVDDVTGSMDIYVNGMYVFAFLGDLTTDGVSTLAHHRLGGPAGGVNCFWSETFICDGDTRSLSLAGFDPVANGNANTFDTGSPSVSNINEVTLDDTTLNGSSVAGQIDQYTNGAVPSGTLDVIGVVISARAQKGESGPSKLALGVRTSGSDYWGSDQALDVAWENIQEVFATNPDTGAVWRRNEIGAAVGFNVGSKSAA